MHNITVMRVPAYSPYAVAEFTERVRSGDFNLDGLVGNDLHRKTVGVLGNGRIGAVVARTLKLEFNCNVLANDLYRNPDLEAVGVQYVDRDQLFRSSDVVCLHCPLTPDTRALINTETLELMKPNALIVNTSRGALVDTAALIDALENGRIRGCALDVHEKERNLFFHQSTLDTIEDPVIKRLILLPNVIVTGHQAILTNEAIDSIAETTLTNIRNFSSGKADTNLAVEKYN